MISLLILAASPLPAQYNIKKLMEEGKRTLDQGYYVTSMQIFSRITALKPNLYEPWYLMALSKYHLEDYKGADEDCQQALKLQPYIPDIFELYAMTCIRQEKFDSAIIAYTKAIELASDKRDYWFNRAYCIYMIDNVKLASEQLDYMLRRWPNFTEATALLRELQAGTKPRRSLPGPSRIAFPKLGEATIPHQLNRLTH